MQPKSPTYKEPEINTTPADSHDMDSIGYIQGRFREMQAQRSNVDVNWPTYQRQIDAQYKAYQDGRPSSNVPLARSLRELFVAESLSMPAIFKHKANDAKYEPNAVANEEVWNYNWRINNYDWSILQSEYTCSTFGTAVYHTHFNKEIREQYDMRSISGLVEIQWDKKYLVKNEILLDNFDIRNFFPDNRVNDFNKALDCIAIQILSYDEYMMLKDNPVYKNIDKVTPVAYNSEPFPNTSPEERGKEGKFVYLYHYWNLAKDRYYIDANHQQIIREHPIMSTLKGAKALPFVMRQFSYNDNSLWGTGLPQMCANYNSQINNLSELLLEGILRSNSEIIMLGDGVELKGEKWVYKNKVLKFSGNLAQNFKQVTGTPPNQAMFAMLDRMYTDIAIYTGIDVRNIIGDAAPTAFQADLQRESSMKRMRTWMQNRNFAFERLADLMHDCLQTYFPIDAPMRIVDTLENYQPQTPAIEIQGKKYSAKSNRFVKTRDNKKSSLDVTKEILEGDMYVDVQVNDGISSSRALHRAQVLEYMSSLGTIVQSYGLAKQSGVDVESIMPIQKVLEKMAREYDLPTQDVSDEKDLKAKGDEMKEKLTAYAQSMGVDTTNISQGNQNTDGQQPQQEIPTGLPTHQ